jgi:hypothetical protein
MLSMEASMASHGTLDKYKGKEDRVNELSEWDIRDFDKEEEFFEEEDQPTCAYGTHIYEGMTEEDYV